MENQDNTASFSSENVELTVKRLPDCKVEFEAKTSPALAKKAKKAAIKTVAKEVTIPGFRKGKAPDDLILSRYEKAVEERWQKDLANLAFKECEKLAMIPVLGGDGQITFKVKEKNEDSATLLFTFESEPLIPEVEFADLKLDEIKQTKIDQEKIDDTIKQIRLFFAKWNPITDRPVQEDDYILLDVDVIEEDPPKRLFSDTRFEVTEKSMAKWMKDLAMGMKTGESKEGESVPDEDAPDSAKEELKPKKVRVTVKAIEEATLPELDETFTARVGAENEADLRTKLEALLNKQANEEVRQAQRDQISDLLVKKYHDLPLPTSIIDKEVQFRFRQLLQDPGFQHRFKSMPKEELEKMQTDIRKQAESAIRLFYLCRKLIADHKIEVSTEELKPSHANLLEMMFDKNYQGDLDKQSEEQKALSLSRLMLSKAHDFIIDQLSKS